MRPKTEQLNKNRKALTLVEMLVALGVIVLMIGLSIPAVKGLSESLSLDSAAQSMISSALASGRAQAAKHQKYAGIRFQTKGLDGTQYMIPIIHDPDLENDMPNRYIAIEGIEPAKLPEGIRVCDLYVRENTSDEEDPNSVELIDSDIEESNSNYEDNIRDATTFSIIFSPAGKLVITEVRVFNRHGETSDQSEDQIFNTENNVTDTDPDQQRGMFIQDDDAVLGLGAEYSRTSFIIYQQEKFKETDEASRYTGYIQNLPKYRINPYTGTIIETGDKNP